MPATTGGPPSSRPGQSQTTYRRPKKKKKRTYTLPDYGSEKNQSPKSAPKTGSNPTGSGDAPASRIPKARQERQDRNAARTRRRVRRVNKRIRREERQERRRERRERQREAGELFARLSKPGRPSDVAFERERGRIQSKLDKALGDLPAAKAESSKPPRQPTESPFPGLSRKATNDEIRRDPEAKAFKKTARKQAVKGFKKERSIEREATKRAENVRRSVDRKMAKEKREEEGKLKVAGIPVEKIGEASVEGAVDILEETTRPLHGIVATLRTSSQGLPPSEVAKAAREGLQNKRKDTFSDVLDDVGVENGVAKFAGGFLLDVAFDPTTYLTFGTAVPARAAALKAGEAMAKKAAESGMSKSGVAAVRRAAEKRVLAEAKRSGKGTNKGLTVGVGRKRTSGKTTSAVSRGLGVSQAATRLRNSSVVQDVGRTIRPDFRAKGVREDAHRATQAAGAQRRAAVDAGTRRLERTAEEFHKLKPADQQRILDAIEQGSLKSLRGDDKIYQAAVRLRSDLRYMNRTERQAGVRASSRKNYVPHVRRQDAELPVRGGRQNARRKPGSAKARKVDATLAELRETHPHLFTEEISKILAKRGTESVRSVARAHFERALAETGRKLDAKSWTELGEAEALYHLAPTAQGGLRKVYPVEEQTGKALDEVEQALAGKGAPGQYVILEERLADDALAAAAPSNAGPVLQFYRRQHGRYKTLLTMPMPSYHLRNLYGDTANAWYGQAAPELMRSLGQSLRAMPELRRMRKGEGKLTLSGQGATKGKAIKIGGERTTHEAELRLAEKHGGLNAGFSRDLHELLGQKPSKIGKLRTVGEMRENLVRYATYLGARKQGLSPSEAAARARELHFDYGDLTKAERGIRDLVPFYTFFARNTPLQAKKLVTKPGRAAAYQKAVEEGAKAAGLPENWQEHLQDYERLGVPLPMFGLESGGAALLALPGLPITDLNRLTTDPVEQFYLAANMFTGFKAIPEIITNYSIFFRGPIDDDGRLVAAPDWLHSPLGLELPEEIKDELGLEYVYDKALDKKVWKYKATWDYLLRQLPETKTLFDLTSSGKNRRGQGQAEKLAALSGVRPVPYRPLRHKSNELYEELEEVNRRLGQLNDRGIYMDNATREYKQLSAKARKIQKRIDQVKLDRRRTGEAVAPPRDEGGAKSPHEKLLEDIEGSGGKAPHEQLLEEIEGSGGGSDYEELLKEIEG